MNDDYLDDSDDEDNSETVPCPHCREPMYEDSPRCPSCGEYITSSDFRKPFPTWLIWVILLTIFGLLLPILWPYLLRLRWLN